MANICFTTLYFYSEDKDKIKAFETKLKGVCKSPLRASHSSIYCVVKEFLPNVDLEKIDCRGDITYIGGTEATDRVTDLESSLFSLCIDVESAWTAQVGIWREIAAIYNFQISYIAEEPLCEYFVVYDPFGLIGISYKVVCDLEEFPFCEAFQTFTDMEAFMRAEFHLPKYDRPTNISDFTEFVQEKLFEKFNLGADSPTEIPLYIYKYDIVDPSEFLVE